MTEEAKKIREEWKALSKTDKTTLKQIYSRSHRVCSLTGIDKTSLVSGIMSARYGIRKIAEAFGN